MEYSNCFSRSHCCRTRYPYSGGVSYGMCTLGNIDQNFDCSGYCTCYDDHLFYNPHCMSHRQRCLPYCPMKGRAWLEMRMRSIELDKHKYIEPMEEKRKKGKGKKSQNEINAINMEMNMNCAEITCCLCSDEDEEGDSAPLVEEEHNCTCPIIQCIPCPYRAAETQTFTDNVSQKNIFSNRDLTSYIPWPDPEAQTQSQCDVDICQCTQTDDDYEPDKKMIVSSVFCIKCTSRTEPPHENQSRMDNINSLSSDFTHFDMSDNLDLCNCCAEGNEQMSVRESDSLCTCPTVNDDECSCFYGETQSPSRNTLSVRQTPKNTSDMVQGVNQSRNNNNDMENQKLKSDSWTLCVCNMSEEKGGEIMPKQSDDDDAEYSAVMKIVPTPDLNIDTKNNEVGPETRKSNDKENEAKSSETQLLCLCKWTDETTGESVIKRIPCPHLQKETQLNKYNDATFTQNNTQSQGGNANPNRTRCVCDNNAKITPVKGDDCCCDPVKFVPCPNKKPEIAKKPDINRKRKRGEDTLQ